MMLGLSKDIQHHDRHLNALGEENTRSSASSLLGTHREWTLSLMIADGPFKSPQIAKLLVDMYG